MALPLGLGVALPLGFGVARPPGLGVALPPGLDVALPLGLAVASLLLGLALHLSVGSAWGSRSSENARNWLPRAILVGDLALHFLLGSSGFAPGRVWVYFREGLGNW